MLGCPCVPALVEEGQSGGKWPQQRNAAAGMVTVLPLDLCQHRGSLWVRKCAYMLARS